MVLQLCRWTHRGCRWPLLARPRTSWSSCPFWIKYLSRHKKYWMQLCSGVQCIHSIRTLDLSNQPWSNCICRTMFPFPPRNLNSFLIISGGIWNYGWCKGSNCINAATTVSGLIGASSSSGASVRHCNVKSWAVGSFQIAVSRQRHCKLWVYDFDYLYSSGRVFLWIGCKRKIIEVAQYFTIYNLSFNPIILPS